MCLFSTIGPNGTDCCCCFCVLLCCADILPGQGLYFAKLTGTWRAQNCNNDSYGVPNITYGLTPASCKDCPQGLVARMSRAMPYSSSARWYSSNATGAGGFTSVMACVTQPGVMGHRGGGSLTPDGQQRRDRAMHCVCLPQACMGYCILQFALGATGNTQAGSFKEASHSSLARHACKLGPLLIFAPPD